jgi:hypothetical protein
MRTPEMLHHMRTQPRFKRLQPAVSRLRRTASQGRRPKHGASPVARVRDALPRMAGDAVDRLTSRRGGR